MLPVAACISFRLSDTADQGDQRHAVLGAWLCEGHEWGAACKLCGTAGGPATAMGSTGPVTPIMVGCLTRQNSWYGSTLGTTPVSASLNKKQVQESSWVQNSGASLLIKQLLLMWVFHELSNKS